MKEEWLFPGAVVPVDVETTAALMDEIKRLIDVVGGLILKQGPDYERGFVDGMQKQAQSSVDKAVNMMAQPTYFIPSRDQRTWVGLTDEEIDHFCHLVYTGDEELVLTIQAKLKEKNNG